MSDPLAIAELSRRSLKDTADQKRRIMLGQFFTPPVTARQMASLSTLSHDKLSFLDAGAGAGALTAAWVSGICSRPRPPKEISLTAVELDEGFFPELTRTLKACEQMCAAAGINCTWEIKKEDFIEMAVHALDADLFRTTERKFDVALLNPPYKKLRSDSMGRSLLRRLGIETSNLYAAFVSLAVLLLKEGGELIAITPRSFCNGPYFLPFRRQLIRYTCLTHFHLFESRDQAFRDDAVLQENVIFRVVKGMKQQSRVLISQSRTPDDPHVVKNNVPFEHVLKKGDPQFFFHLVPDGNGHAVARAIESLPCKLSELGLTVSTGRVVDFRARQWLRMAPSEETVPLIYPSHFEKGSVIWPKPHIRKPNAILLTDESSSLMVPAGAYTLVRRFSAKEERRRVVSAVFDPAGLSFSVVGFENHLNYFHQDGKPLPLMLARGLSAFLNSTLVDCYFRQFNGHTQVNAEDLRALRYPVGNVLIALGRHIGDRLPEQDALDSLVEEIVKRNESKCSGTAHSGSPSSVDGFRIAEGTTKRKGRPHPARPSRSPASKTVD
jgi:adenine-specific DNA-methyltransferase